MAHFRKSPASAVALGGVLAAMAMGILGVGGLIPGTTILCPILCALLMAVVQKRCGSRMAWAWYGAVAFLGALVAPDKEAAALFVFLGYYPIVKPKLERRRFPWLWKLLLFNGVIAFLYLLLLKLLGLEEIVQSYQELGTVMTAVTLLLGNCNFILLDRLLTVGWKR